MKVEIIIINVNSFLNVCSQFEGRTSSQIRVGLLSPLSLANNFTYILDINYDLHKTNFIYLFIFCTSNMKVWTGYFNTYIIFKAAAVYSFGQSTIQHMC